MGETNQYIELGIIGRAKGLQGTVRVQLHNAKSEYLNTAKSILVQSPTGQRETWTIKSVRNDGERGVVFLNTAELVDRVSAEQRQGWTVLMPPEDLPPLAEGEFYYFQVIGLPVVTPSGTEIGTIADAFDTNRTIFSIHTTDGKELLIPVTNELVLDVDVSKGAVVVAEDLLERFGELL